MDNFIHVFKEEAHELIGELENALLSLENNPKDEKSIDQIFRIMHTLKGNSDMFGLGKIGEITHQLENVYDEIRNNKVEVSENIFSTTLSTVDHIRILLEEKDDIKHSTQERHNLLRNELFQLTKVNGNVDSEEASLNEISSNSDTIQSDSTYLVSFKPNTDFLKDGSNPLYLLDDLAVLGQILIITDQINIPPLSQLNPTDCHTSWHFILVTGKDRQEIMDVFMFAEQNCSLEVIKISKGNLLSNKQFVGYFNELTGQEIDSNELIEYAEELKKPESKNQAKTDNGSSLEDKISSIRVSSDKLDQLMNLVSELITTQARLNMIAEEISSDKLESVNEDIEKLTRQLRGNTFSICLIPINSIKTRFQRLIRDLSIELNKDVKFSLEGGATELDKNIIESLSEPLLHILRNSMGHGIEPVEERLKAGKDKNGNIQLKAFYSGSNVYIQIIDDGAGIDPLAVKKKAIEKGIYDKSHNLTKAEISDLLFQPGFSTSQSISNVSGRGVGMDVVKRKIESIQGEVSIESDKGVGTTVTIKLPLTLSILDGLLVSVNKTQFVLPLSVVDQIYVVGKDKIADTFNHLVVLDGKQIQFLNLRKEFEMEGDIPELSQAVVVKYGNRRVALIFDKLEGEYQAVLKPLGKLFKYQEFISGATILGDGSVALVLDTNKIINHLIN